MPTYDDSFAEWRRILKPFINNPGEISILGGHVEKLTTLLAQADQITGQQAALAAAKQETSRQLKGVVVEGRKAAAFLKAGIRDHYGKEAEKLTEYGLQPFRGKKAGKPGAPAEAKAPAAPQTDPNP